MLACVIPCYKVSRQILQVLDKIPAMVDLVLVVDDGCPEESGRLVEAFCKDQRVMVTFHEKNQGVGGAVCTGYALALKYGATIVVKLDGDGQMDPGQIPDLIAPIARHEADYTKGNRFFDFRYLSRMPRVRVVGNLGVSFVSKFSSGYWRVMDPANGFTAIHARVLELLPLEKIDRGYFFESDMLYHLGLVQAVVKSIPMPPVYGQEESNLSIARVSLTFPGKYMARFIKRLFYTYYFRDLNAGSFYLFLGVVLTLWGGLFGAYHWWQSVETGIFASAGTVMVATVPLVVGLQCLMAGLQFDMAAEPRAVIHPGLEILQGQHRKNTQPRAQRKGGPYGNR